MNKAGIVYSNQINITTPSKAPVAYKATDKKSDGFTAHWKSIAGTNYYNIDVSKSSKFIISKPDSVYEQFNNGTTPPQGWVFTGGVEAHTTIFGKAAPSIEFLGNGAYIATPTFKDKVKRHILTIESTKFFFFGI